MPVWALCFYGEPAQFFFAIAPESSVMRRKPQEQCWVRTGPDGSIATTVKAYDLPWLMTPQPIRSLSPSVRSGTVRKRQQTFAIHLVALDGSRVVGRGVPPRHRFSLFYRSDAGSAARTVDIFQVRARGDRARGVAGRVRPAARSCIRDWSARSG